MEHIPTLSEWARLNCFDNVKRRLLTDAEKSTIRALLKSKTVKQVALEVGRSYQTIYNLTRKK